MEINNPNSSEFTPKKFSVVVIKYEPNKRCASGYYDTNPFIKWLQCSAKYTIAFDGYNFRPRSYNLPEMRSDDGHRFFGSDGQYLALADKANYIAKYMDEGDQFLETGMCQEK